MSITYEQGASVSNENSTVKTTLDMIRNELIWMIEENDSTVPDAAVKAGLPKARLDRFLRAESDDFTVEEMGMVAAAFNWAWSIASGNPHAQIDWYDKDEAPIVPRPVDDPAPGLNAEPLD